MPQTRRLPRSRTCCFQATGKAHTAASQSACLQRKLGSDEARDSCDVTVLGSAL